MRLNKTLKLMRELNEQGYALAVYGSDKLEKVLNFKAVKSFTWDGDLNGGYFTLVDGSTIYVNYSEIAG